MAQSAGSRRFAPARSARRWASSALAKGYVFEVQVRYANRSTWTNFVDGTTAMRRALTPSAYRVSN